MKARTVAALAVLGSVAYCGGLVPRSDPFVDEMVLMEARQTQRRDAEALAMAEGLLQLARTDEERCRITFVEARALAGLGRYKEAVDAFGRVQAECEQVPLVSARALFELGVFVSSSSPDPLDALPVFQAVVTRFPDEPSAKRAVVWALDILKKRIGPASAVNELRAMYGEVARSSVGPYLVFEAARLAEGLDEDGPAKALSLYHLIIERHPDSSLVDDALFDSARIGLDMGLTWDAIAFLKEILARRETSLLFGSYDTSMYPKATFLLAEALYRATGDTDDAIARYRSFISSYPDSSKRDDAWFRIYELLDGEGRESEARRVLETLARDSPLSAKGRAAKRILKGEME